MTRVVLLIAALASCAPGYSASTRKPAKLWMHAVDMGAFALGACVGMDAHYGRPSDTRTERMAIGYGIAGIVWLSYWLIETGGQP